MLHAGLDHLRIPDFPYQANGDKSKRLIAAGRMAACGPTEEVLGGADPLALFRAPEAAA